MDSPGGSFDIARDELWLSGVAFWVTPGLHKRMDMEVTFGGHPEMPGSALSKKAPRKRSPAREPEMSPRRGTHSISTVLQFGH